MVLCSPSFSKISVRNNRTVSTELSKGEIVLLLQNSHHFLKQVSYCLYDELVIADSVIFISAFGIPFCYNALVTRFRPPK